MIILHGDNEVALYAELTRQIEAAKTSGLQITKLDGKKITVVDLEQAVGTDLLFSPQKLVVIGGLIGSLKGKRKDDCLTWLTAASLDNVTVILTENKVLTATQLKSFPNAKVVQFKYPSVMFAWIESLGVVPAAKCMALFHQVLEHEPAEICFSMLVRQIRLLLSFKADGVFVGPPFARIKLQKQAQFFSLEKLLALHRQLLNLDELQKTSGSALSLSQNLDLLLSEL